MRGKLLGGVVAAAMAAASAFATPAADAGVITISAQSGARGTLQDGNGDGVVDLGISPVDQLFQSSILVRTFPTINFDSRGIAEFNISAARAAIGDPSLITSARLVLNAFTGGTVSPLTPNGISITPGFELDLYGYVGNGVIDVGDFGLGTLLASQTLDGASGVVTFDATGFVVPEILGSASFVGVNLRTPFDQLIGATPFAQFRTGPDPFQPQLIIEFDDPPPATAAVPAPPALALFATGLFGLAVLNRRRRHCA